MREISNIFERNICIMKLVKVKELPKKIAARHNLQDIIQEFVNSDSRIVKIDIENHEYKNTRCLYGCIRVAVKRSKHPIKVHMRKDVVYLEKI